MTAYVPYIRVSTSQQGRSGLGLDAQEEAIRQFLKPGDVLLSPTFREIESGKRGDRPQLAKALERAKLTGGTVLVAKLDRLSRDAKFLLTLIDGGVDVAFGDLPHIAGPMGRFIITQMAAVAELEAGLISQRTKAALAAAKERNPSLKLGGFRGHNVDPSLGLEARRHSAAEFNARVQAAIEALRTEGVNSLGGIAKRLNDLGVKSRRGGDWSATQVARVLA